MTIDTFKDLFEFLQKTTLHVTPWLRSSWKGKDKQESLLRLFAGLGLIEKLKHFKMCKGCFNTGDLENHSSCRDIFYDEKYNLKKLKDKGDKSDLTMTLEGDDEVLLATSSKSRQNSKNEAIGGYDIRDILHLHKKHHSERSELRLCICCKDILEFRKTIKRSEKTSNDIKEELEKVTTIYIDWTDLEQAYHTFKILYSDTPIEEVLNFNKKPLVLLLHQRVAVLKTLRMKNCEKKRVLWGHIMRSGKSYIMGGCIRDYSKNKGKCNFLILTMCPSETIQGYNEVFKEHRCFKEFEIIEYNDRKKKYDFKDKNIIILSQPFLRWGANDDDVDEITDLINMKFDMVFFDESHYGGSSPLAKKILNMYAKDTFTIQITATYDKPSVSYDIPQDNWILWGIEDIKLCKKIKNKGARDKLIEKHGKEMEQVLKKKEFSMQNIITEYSKYPEFMYLTDELTTLTIDKLIKRNTMKGCQDDGDSLKARFLLNEQKYSRVKNNEERPPTFQRKDRVLDIFYRMFGKKILDEFGGRDDPEYPNSFMKRIENQATECGSRFIGKGYFENEPMVIMAFLPEKNIHAISTALKNLLEKENVIPDYDIIKINSIVTPSSGKQEIDNALIKARNKKRKGILVLSGRQCSLGVTIDNCDIVLLLNNNMSFDRIFQMMFRGLTPGKGKRCGFVVDFDTQRAIYSAVTYAIKVKPNIHPKEAIKQVLYEERIINLNKDHWNQIYGNDEINKKIEQSEYIYKLYSSNIITSVKYQLNRLYTKHLLSLSCELQNNLDNDFKMDSVNPKRKKKIKEEKKIKDGVKKTTVVSTVKSDGDDEKIDDGDKVNYMTILYYMVPIVSFITIYDDETSFVKMLQSIVNDNVTENLLIEHLKTCFGKDVCRNSINTIISIYNIYMITNKESNEIIKTIKELFTANRYNPEELSRLIDIYWIPTELEKNKNAEVSTRYEQRQLMLGPLDKYPDDFWKSVKPVFEPCCGKGGFIIDIIDKFMNGLKDKIKDKDKRYKTIVEQCLYFADINPINIFICKHLINRGDKGKYKLNYNLGDSLKLDITEDTETWKGVEGFEAVIGNPPYNSSGNIGSGNTIWQNFTRQALEKWLKSNGYLVYVHPPGWRKPNTERGKFYGLYNLMCKDNQMIYLSIHGIKDGLKTFNCGTRYDWYLIQKTSKYTTTIVNDEKNTKIVIDMGDFNWLPNFNISDIQKLLAKDGDEKCEIIQSMSAYEPRKKWMSKEKTDEYKYPCIHTTPKKGPRYKFSRINDKGHFGVSKVIFGDSGINEPIIDMKGEYGMTQHAMGIGIENEAEGRLLSQSLKSNKMKVLIDSCSFSSYAIDWNLFKDLKKDFWKEY